VPCGRSPPTETIRPFAYVAPVPPRACGIGASRAQRRVRGSYASKRFVFVSIPALRPPSA